MTENSVLISITIKVSKREIKIEKEIQLGDLEEAIQGIVEEAGQQTLILGIEETDEEMAKEVPKNWRNVGTEERWVVTSIGELRYRRRIYLDEQGQRRKPVDEVLGIERYGRRSERVQEIGSMLAYQGTYREAARQLSWMIKTPVSHSAIQRMVWRVGNRIADGEESERRRVFERGGAIEPGKIASKVLYGESDGVWVHLQREKRKSAEVRVATLSTGRKPVGKDRYRLENKRCITAVGCNSESWQERIAQEAYQFYDLSQTKLLISGGDGNHWVRHSFDCLDIHQEFFLDRFHLQRAARRAFQSRPEAAQTVTRLQREGFPAVQKAIQQQIDQAVGRKQELLKDFYQYVSNSQDGLLDLEKRGYTYPVCLGGIEGNVDKQVVHRMKGQGCSWRLQGLRAMLALGSHVDELALHAYQYLPIQTPPKKAHRSSDLEVEYSETTQMSMPIFQGPDQGKPWVRSFHRLIHGR